MQVRFTSIQNNIDGVVTVKVNGKTVTLADGDRVEVVVEPFFYHPADSPNVLFSQVELTEGNTVDATSRDLYKLSGVKGTLRRTPRSAVVKSRFEQKRDEPQE